MIALPTPETVQPRLEPYGAAVTEAYHGFFTKRSEDAFNALTESILRSLAEFPGDEKTPRGEWHLQHDLGIDSIGLAEAAFLVEDLFQVRLDNAILQEIETVDDLRNSLATHVWLPQAPAGTGDAS